MVHAVLQRPVEVGESLCAAAEAHAGAEVVAAGVAVLALVAHDAGLDRDALAWDEVFYARADGGDDPSGFVAEDHGGLQGEIAVPAMGIVVDWDDVPDEGCGGEGENIGNQGGYSRSLPQRPVETTATWAQFGCGGQRVRSSSRRSLGP